MVSYASLSEALAAASTSDNRTGDFPTSQGWYFLDIGGGADLGPAGIGKSFSFHTESLNSGYNAIETMGSSFPIDFWLKWMDGDGNLKQMSEISARGGNSITAYGFSYKAEGGDWTQVQVGINDLQGNFDYTLTGLTANTEYYFKAYAANAEGTAYGQEKSFLVLQEQSPFGPGSKMVLRFYIGKYQYFINDQEHTMDIVPVIIEDRTLLPIRYVAEHLGATVNWDAKEQKATISFNGQTIELWIGKSTAMVNGISVPIDPNNPAVAPIIQEPGRVMLPLRFISEPLGCTVDWSSDKQEAKVIYP